MRISKSALIKGAAIALLATGTIMTSSAGAQTVTKTYVACNRYDECWKVREQYKNYPTDERIVIHDDTWYESHQHDTQWHWLSDRADDHGWYDKDGAWHAFSEAPPNH